ncbi:hypothetical protein GF322_04035 [Candidatus Dependentiae bacterium]|nr:hypothetical protein [Candidatus Dependentiae bacterium]
MNKIFFVFSYFALFFINSYPVDSYLEIINKVPFKIRYKIDKLDQYQNKSSLKGDVVAAQRNYTSQELTTLFVLPAQKTIKLDTGDIVTRVFINIIDSSGNIITSLESKNLNKKITPSIKSVKVFLDQKMKLKNEKEKIITRAWGQIPFEFILQVGNKKIVKKMSN